MADSSTVNPGLEEYGREQYASLRPRIRELRSRALAVTLAPGGLLASEDDKTAYSPISHQVRFQLQLASEHLTALDQLIEAHGLPNYAGYVLIRVALASGACSAASWRRS